MGFPFIVWQIISLSKLSIAERKALEADIALAESKRKAEEIAERLRQEEELKRLEEERQKAQELLLKSMKQSETEPKNKFKKNSE